MRRAVFVVMAISVMSAAIIVPERLPGQTSRPQISPVQLVREVVYNELHDHASHGYWRFRVTDRGQDRLIVSDQVETTDGPVSRIVLADGQPLSPQYEMEEDARLLRLLHSPAEQEQQRRQHQKDEQRVEYILSLLPDAFLYDFDSQTDGCYRLSFRPNPDFSTSSVEGRIFHAMSGSLWVDARAKHLARLEGHVDSNVDFGFGILGRVYKGGWFLLERTQVWPAEWKTARLEIHMNIRALMVKSFAKETSETRSDFARVSADTNLTKGVMMLEKGRNGAAEREVAVDSSHSSNAFVPLAMWPSEGTH